MGSAQQYYAPHDSRELEMAAATSTLIAAIDNYTASKSTPQDNARYGSGQVGPVTGHSDFGPAQVDPTAYGSDALGSVPAHNPNTTTSTNPPAPGKTHMCYYCKETFPDKELRKAHVKEVHHTWHCTWPGCKRKEAFHHQSSYRRHMRDIHQVELKTDKEMKQEEQLAAKQDQIEPMQAYLQGAGRSLPADTRVHGRKRPRDDISEDVSVLQEENKRLRGMLDKMGVELRKERARAEQEVQSMEQARRAEAAKMYQEHQDELKQLQPSNSVWTACKDELIQLRWKLKVKQEEEIKKIHARHDLNERRLWNLFNPYE